RVAVLVDAALICGQRQTAVGSGGARGDRRGRGPIIAAAGAGGGTEAGRQRQHCKGLVHPADQTISQHVIDALLHGLLSTWQSALQPSPEVRFPSSQPAPSV